MFAAKLDKNFSCQHFCNKNNKKKAHLKQSELTLMAIFPYFLITFNEVAYQTEDGFIAIELHGLVRIIDSMVILESITFLVL